MEKKLTKTNRILKSLLLLLAPAVSIEAQASIFYQYSLNTKLTGAGADGNQTFSDTDGNVYTNLAGRVNVNRGISGAWSGQFASAQVASALGGLHMAAYAGSQGIKGSYIQTSHADVSEKLFDSFVVNPSNPALLGQAGTLTLSFNVDARYQEAVTQAADNVSLPYNWYYDAAWSADVKLTSEKTPGVTLASSAWHGLEKFSPDEQNMANGFDVLTTTGTTPGIYQITLGIIFGQQITAQIWGSLSANSQTDYRFAVGSGLNMLNSIDWNGISSVKDQSGNAITDYTAQSTNNNYDYRFAAPPAAVPLPGSFGMLLAGLGLLGLSTRKNNKVKA